MATKLVSLIGTWLAFAAVVSATRQGTSLEDSKAVDAKNGNPASHHLNGDDDDDAEYLATNLREIFYNGTNKEPRSSHVIVPCTRPTSISTHAMDRGDTVTFSSPRYPRRRYPRRRNCGWRLQGIRSDITIGIECSDFQMENRRRGNCRDFLQLPGTRFCGKFSSRPVGWMSSGNSVAMRFYSNRRRNYKGFSCVATAHSTQTTTTTTTTTVTQSTTTNTAPTVPESCSCGIPNRSTRIVGGMPTEVNEYPWQVAMAATGNDDFQNFYCGGSIINKRWVLTAAHCEVSSSDQVIVGAHEWNSPPASRRRVNIESVINHVSYDSVTVDNDIAVVRLAEDLDFTDVGLAPVCLPSSGSSSTYAGVKATVSGWGKLQHGTSNYPAKLQEVEIDVVTNAICALDYGPGDITANMLCAGIDAGGKDSCQGDSGGPLVTESNGAYTQIGVVSWGFDCASADYYGVYARVTQYVDWIKASVGDVCHQ